MDFTLYYAAITVDNAWARELRKLYGESAGDARYDKRGESTPRLKQLKEAKIAADETWINHVLQQRLLRNLMA